MGALGRVRWQLAWRYFLISMVCLLVFSACVVLGYVTLAERALHSQLVRQASWLAHAPNVPPSADELEEELREISLGSDHPLGFMVLTPSGEVGCRLGLLADGAPPADIFRNPDERVFSLRLRGEPCLALCVTPPSPQWSRALVVISAADRYANLRWLLLALLLGSLLAALLLFTLGLHLSAQALRPVLRSYRQMQTSLADASHELRTPLTAIMGEAEVALRHPRRPEEYREALNYCASYSRQMLAVVEGVLELSRADADIPIVDAQPVDLGQLAASEVEQLRRQSAPLPVIEVALPEQVIVEGDSELLARALRNVLDNALHHTPSTGRIEVLVSRSQDDRMALLSVADTGAGIPADELPFIFDRFFQGRNSGHGETLGSGLGLAIVKALIEAHHGSVDVTSQVGIGTTLTLKLPLAG